MLRHRYSGPALAAGGQYYRLLPDRASSDTRSIGLLAYLSQAVLIRDARFSMRRGTIIHILHYRRIRPHLYFTCLILLFFYHWRSA